MARQRFWLCLPPVVLAAADLILTLTGQSPAYWAGDFASVHELNPLGNLLLRWHPLAFTGVGILWIVGFSIILWHFPVRLALALAFMIAASHAMGGATWLWMFERLGPVIAIAYLVAAERLIALSWKKVGCRSREEAA